MYFCPGAQATALARVEDTAVFIQDELHNLVLEDHVHGDVRRLRLRPKKRWAKHNGNILYGHAIVFSILNYPFVHREREREETVSLGKLEFTHGQKYNLLFLAGKLSCFPFYISVN